MVLSHKRTIKDIIKVTISNVVNLFSGVLVGFLLPKIIGVTDYGYYKTFTLYATYAGLLHFGFSDGIYLKFGDKNYDELEKSKFRLYSSFFFILEFTLALLLSICFFLLLDGELKFIFLCLVVYVLSINIINFYQIISQITKRFNELSLRNLIQSLLTCIAIIILFVIHKLCGTLLSYKIYTLIFTFIFVALAVWYTVTYRDLTFGKRDLFSNNKKEIFSFFATGLPLLIANLCSSLILTIDRQFVNVLFDTDTYAVYAFAYNMMALITTALSAISTVLYPTLKRLNKESLQKNYSLLIKTILIIVFACLVVFFPLSKFVPWFLPKYIDSIPIFRIILPGLAISSVITIVMHNYYKTDGKELSFFIKSIIVLLLSIASNVAAYSIFKTTLSISIASIAVMIFWYFIVEEYFIRTYKVRWFKNFSYMLLMSTGFYLITIWDNWWATLLIYLCLFLILTSLFYYKDIIIFFKKIFNKNDNQNSVSD